MLSKAELEYIFSNTSTGSAGSKFHNWISITREETQLRVRGARGRMHLKTRVGATDIARNHKLLTSHYARYPKRRQSADVSNGVPQSSIGRFAVDGGRAQQQTAPAVAVELVHDSKPKVGSIRILHL
jgi:hypothetical protein